MGVLLPLLALISSLVRGRSAAQGIVEYGLILSLGALLAVGILVFMGGTVADVLDFVARAVEASERGS
jgi:Flp pilus assembly pilin Flp